MISLLAGGCTLPGTNDGDSPVDNPDPYPYGSSEEIVDIGYSIYANVDGRILQFDSDESDFYTVIATDINPDNPRFFITEADSTKYVVFTRDENESGDDGHFIVVKNLDSDDNEIYLEKATASQNLTGEFVVRDGHVIYSDSGVLKDYDIANPENVPVKINALLDEYECNHFINITSDGLLSFTEQDPSKNHGTIHVIPYDGTPQDVLSPSMPFYNYSFGARFYPVTFSADALICLAEPTYANTIFNYFDFEKGPTFTEITCHDTDSVQFCKIYQTPGGTKTFLYGYNSVYWFDSADRPMSSDDFEVSGRDFSSTIRWITATPDDAYIVLHDTYGIWVYDSNFDQVHCTFSWLNDENEVLWLDVK